MGVLSGWIIPNTRHGGFPVLEHPSRRPWPVRQQVSLVGSCPTVRGGSSSSDGGRCTRPFFRKKGQPLPCVGRQVFAIAHGGGFEFGLGMRAGSVSRIPFHLSFAQCSLIRGTRKASRRRGRAGERV